MFVYRCCCFLLLIALPPCILSSAVFWRFTKDRYERPTLTDELQVPDGTDPYLFLAQHRGFESWMIRQNSEGITVLAEKATIGEVPILCFHKISSEEEYALSAERFRSLLMYINKNNWYLVSDEQYLQGDFSRVPTGMKPIVMGADDASYGHFIHETQGDPLTGSVKRFLDKPVLDKNSMVALLERYIKKEEGRINFTFYVSFDAIPFRQLDMYKNPGFPYRGIPIVAEKILYIDKNFRLGLHTLSHKYAYDMSPDNFAEEVLASWELLEEYTGGKTETIRTMAFPYGVDFLTDELKKALLSISHRGHKLSGSFDLDNKLAPPPGSPRELFDISRINVENKNWKQLLHTLDNAQVVKARREIIVESDSKKLPFSHGALGVALSDVIWVLIK